MLFYHFASVVVALLTTSLLLFSVFFRRHIVIKPSFWIAFCFNLRVQWAAVFEAGDLFETLVKPWDMFALCHAFPLFCGLWSIVGYDRLAKNLWSRISRIHPATYGRLLVVVPKLAIFMFTALLIYFIWVPISNTGLYVALSSGDFLLSREAREASLKLLNNPIPRYAYALNANFVSKALGVSIAIILLMARRKLTFRINILLVLLGMIAVLSPCLSGARSPGGYVVLTMIFGVFIAKRAPLDLRLAAFGVVATLAIPTTMTLVRSGEQISFNTVRNSFTEVIFGRIFVTPLHVAIHHVDYVQRGEFWGVSGFPKLARLIGSESVHVDNIIANAYRDGVDETTSYSTVGAVFTDYTRFGMAIFPVTLVLTLVLDWVLVVCKRLKKDYLLVPAISCLVLSCIFVVSSNYETIFLTRGLVVAMIVFYFMGRKVDISREPLRPGKRSSRLASR